MSVLPWLACVVNACAVVAFPRSRTLRLVEQPWGLKGLIGGQVVKPGMKHRPKGRLAKIANASRFPTTVFLPPSARLSPSQYTGDEWDAAHLKSEVPGWRLKDEHARSDEV